MSRDESPSWRVLGGLAVLALVIRVVVAHDKTFYGDECGTMLWICSPVKYLLTHFQEWLTMNWFLVLEKGIAAAFGEGFLAMRAVSILSGSALVVLVGVLATRWGMGRFGWIAATFVAVQPYLIKFSVMARAYALFAALSLGLWLLFLRWRRAPTWGNGLALSALSAITLLSHMNGAFVVIWIGVMFGLELVWTAKDREERGRYLAGIGRLSIPYLALNGAAALYYWQLREELREFRGTWAEKSVTSLDYLPLAFQTYFLDAGTAWVFFGLMLVGMVAVAKSRPKTGLQVLLWAAVPVLGASLAGYSHYPWAMARFHIFVMPVIVMLCAIGWGTAAAWFPGGGRKVVVSLGVAAAVVWWGFQDVQAYQEDQRGRYHLAAEHYLNERTQGDRFVGYTFIEDLRVRSYLPCEERTSGPRPGMSFVNEMMKDSSARAFVVAYSEHVPKFPVDSVQFGDIHLFEFPGGGPNKRIRQITRGLESVAESLGPDHLCADCADVFAPLADLARLEGNSEEVAQHSKRVRRSKALSARAKHRP